MSEELVRKLPFSLIAEQSLLGSILIDPKALNEIADLITSDDFYLDEHRQIYLAFQELFSQNSEIDLVTLIDTLVRKGIYDKSGGQEYIRTLAEVVPNALNVKDYARIVKEKSTLRRLIEVASDISEAAYSEQDSVAGILESAQNSIYAIAQGRDTKNFKHIREVIGDVYAHLHELKDNKNAAQGTSTGFSGLDRVLAGMGKSDLILVGARPGMGKTSFCLNIATNVAS
jgi:replicative DNA helicase